MKYLLLRLPYTLESGKIRGMNRSSSNQTSVPKLSRFFNFLCMASIVGIWPRFIEPYLLTITRKTLCLSHDFPSFKGLKVLHFADLHFSAATSKKFLDKILKASRDFAPDIVIFSGDFICRAVLENEEKLIQFLNGFSARLGCFAVLGNHDYDAFVSVDNQGIYNVSSKGSSLLKKGLIRLFNPIKLQKKRADKLKEVGKHQELLQLLKKTPFQLLDNETIVLKEANITGLGEYMVGDTHPEVAYRNYDAALPGIAIVHNPDAIPQILQYPSQLILCGHTHGGQINVPILWKNFTLIEHQEWCYGEFAFKNKRAFVSRGVGGVVPLRLFSPPELVFYELT